MRTRTAGGCDNPARHEDRKTPVARSTAARNRLPGLVPLGMALIAVMAWIAIGAPRATAFVMKPLDSHTVAVTLDIAAETVEKAKEDASLRAVRACVGRIFWGHELLLAVDLLSDYLRNEHPRFVRGIEVLRTDFLAGRPQLQLRVFVDNAALEADLREKRFVYTPRPRPFFAVFLSERLGEDFAPFATGRTSVESAIRDRNLYPFEGRLERPPLNVAVAADPILLEDALIACERNGIELLVSGTSVTHRDDVRELYYDTYYFYTTEIEVVMIRVDTGDILGQARAKGTASHTEEQRAIDTSITRAAIEVANALSLEYEKVWAPMVLSRADYHLLLTGVTPETLSLVSDALAGFSADAQVHLRQSFDRTAVLNVVYPGGREELLKTISTLSYPTLSVIPPLRVTARIDTESSLRLVDKVAIAARLGERLPEDVKGSFNYTYESTVELRMTALGAGGPFVVTSATGKANGLNEKEAAYESWREALGKALLELVRHFPPEIQVVLLREGAYTIRLPRAPENLALHFEKQIQKETSFGQVRRRVERGTPTLTLRYPEPKDETTNLLGRDPFLPDVDLIRSPRINYIEVQVGE